MASGDVYEKTGASTWTKRATLAAAGQAEGWWSGAGVPTAAVGADGDWYLDTTAAITPYPPSLVSSLPGSPVDGQEVYYLADATNGIVWHLRYRSAATGSYKWEFIGGSSLTALVDASQTKTGSGYGDLTTVGPSIALPLAGDYMVETVFQAAQDTSTAFAQVSVDGSTTWAFWQPAGANVNGWVCVRGPRTSLTGTIKMTYATGGTGTATFQHRRLTVQPVRVG